MSWFSPVIPAEGGIQPLGPGVRRDGDLSRRVALALLAGALLSVAGCGFKLRGQQDFPFDTISVPSGSPLGTELRRNIAAASERTTVIQELTGADAVLTLLTEQQEKVIIALNTQGRVTEYQLRYRVAFRVSSPKGLDFIPSTAVVLTRDITFNNQVLAKEAEEGQLYAEMRADMVQQIIRRLARAKPVPTEDE